MCAMKKALKGSLKDKYIYTYTNTRVLNDKMHLLLNYAAKLYIFKSLSSVLFRMGIGTLLVAQRSDLKSLLPSLSIIYLRMVMVFYFILFCSLIST